MDKGILQKCVSNEIEILSLREHSKASEKYVDLRISLPDKTVWEGSIPYFYRRTGLFIETEIELIDYINEIKHFFLKKNINEFIEMEKARWDADLSGKETTKGFFLKLINLQWNSVEKDLPNNPNWARRIQDIKELGYTLATNTNMRIQGTTNNGTHIMLIPLPKGGVTGYEVMSASFKQKVINALSAVNAYELSTANRHGLLPDHKFPEIRWDATTRKTNESLTDAEIKSKFQLLDNQRNQQKREICRNCFQTNKRGIIFGIEYFYEGCIDWPDCIPKIGIDAEQGCIGCGWYDIQKWRNSLNELLTSIK
jgi:hypothetical protein